MPDQRIELSGRAYLDSGSSGGVGHTVVHAYEASPQPHNAYLSAANAYVPSASSINYIPSAVPAPGGANLYPSTGADGYLKEQM